MRARSAALVLDAAVLVSAALGRSSRAIWEVAQRRALVTTERAVEEARRRIALGFRRPEILVILDGLIEDVAVVPMESLEPLLGECASCLRDAVSSRNGSTADAHILSLAWDTNADIWSSDRDFAGTGVASWSTPNLVRALGGAGA